MSILVQCILAIILMYTVTAITVMVYKKLNVAGFVGYCIYAGIFNILMTLFFILYGLQIIS